MRWAVGGIIGSAALSRCARVPRAVRHPGWKHTWLYVGREPLRGLGGGDLGLRPRQRALVGSRIVDQIHGAVGLKEFHGHTTVRRLMRRTRWNSKRTEGCWVRHRLPSTSGRGATRPWSHGASERLRGAVPTVHQLTGSRRLAIRSAGVSQPSVFRGRLLSPAATASGRSSVCGEKPMSLGKFCRRRPLVFSFEPRCQGLAV